MVDKVKATIDTDALASITEAHAENDKGMTSIKAIDASLTAHGAATSKGGIYAFLADKAFNTGMVQKKANQKASFDDRYNGWWLANHPDKEADDVPAGDRSAFNAWANAGHVSKDKPWARDVADKVLALKNVSLSSRAGFLNKLLALPKTPTDEEWQKDVPNETGGGSGGGTPKSVTLAVVRAVNNALALLDDMPESLRDVMADALRVAERLEVEASKIKTTKKEAADEKAKAKAAKIAANIAKLRKATSGAAMKLDS